ncbi:MAG: D-alanyl-D-alanine carboxypeptidase [Ruminococcus sp.]|nr:D-alanyl-D-alanine carboxypeptidase [Ruminococcus sp.]
MNIKKAFIVFACSIITLIRPISVSADGTVHTRAQTAQATIISDNSVMNEVTAESAILVEISTGTVIAEKNSDEKVSASHLAKLMTILLAEEKINQGKLNFQDKATVSVNANSKGAPQIWLDVGETITVDELLKSITIGNANDGCTALAEKISGTEQEFVELMNKKAKSLGMNNTYFADCTGISEKTVSTAYDLALLSAEILKFDELTPYFTTWMTNIRNDAVELVSTNRLIRTYKGIKGVKSCASKESGECLIAAAQRSNMSLCAVVLKSNNDDSKFNDVKSLLDYAFANYEIYEPEIDEKALENIKVKGGEQLESEVMVKDLTNIVIPRGTYSQISCKYEREETIEAPASKNCAVGEIVFLNGENEILKGKIVVKDDIKQNSFLFSFKRILLNLFK